MGWSPVGVISIQDGLQHGTPVAVATTIEMHQKENLCRCKELFYVTTEGRLMAAEVAVRNGTLEVGQVRELFNGIATGLGLTYDVSAEGQ